MGHLIMSVRQHPSDVKNKVRTLCDSFPPPAIFKFRRLSVFYPRRATRSRTLCHDTEHDNHPYVQAALSHFIVGLYGQVSGMGRSVIGRGRGCCF
jgi:hypothetical protein